MALEKYFPSPWFFSWSRIDHTDPFLSKEEPENSFKGDSISRKTKERILEQTA
jgi:hypothetical protein